MVFKSIFLDLYGPVGSLPFQVNGSNNTAELQAPLEAIAFMLLHPPLPPHIIFHLDSQYVIDLLLGLSLPSSNIELAILLLDFYHYLASRTYVELRKVKSHTGIPGNDRADLNASNGITSCTPIDRFATFQPLTLPVLPRMDTPSSAQDSLKIVQANTSSSDECFPPKSSYSLQTLHLIGYHLTYCSIAPHIFH